MTVQPPSGAAPGSSERRRDRARPGLWELGRTATWLGLVGFGGGLSVLSLIHRTAVERRRWLTEREFNNTATVAQLLPGGAAANALAYVGLRFQGVTGALVAYLGFSLPGAIAVLTLAWAYVKFGMVPHLEPVLGGFNAAVVGIIVAITLQMARSGIARLWQLGVAAGAALLSLGGGASSGEVALLGVAVGLLLDLGTKRARLHRWQNRREPPPIAMPDEGHRLPHKEPEHPHPPGRERDPRPPMVPGGATPLHVVAVVPALVAGLLMQPLVQLGLVFFLTGLGSYGGGFAIIPHLRNALAGHGWLTDRQLADAVAIAKITPGPVLLVATFVGYLVGRTAGAIVATVAVFAAPFMLVVTLGAWLDRARSRRPVRAALRGLTPAVIGLMVAAALTLGGTLSSGTQAGIAAVVALAMTRFALNPVVVMGLAGLAGFLLRGVGL